MKLAATTLIVCVAALLTLGMVMLYSSLLDHDGAAFPLMQTACCGVGVVLAGMLAWLDYRHLRRAAWLFYGAALVLLVAVLVLPPPFSRAVNGAKRWIYLGGFSFQPSEFAKIAVILFLAGYCDRFQRQIGTFRRGVVLPGLLLAPVLFLVFREPDWGTTALLAAVSCVMLLVAGVRWRFFVPPVLLGLAVFCVAIMNDPVRSKRVTSWLNVRESQDGTGFQGWNSMKAIGAGGAAGVGLGNSTQKHGYLVEHETDFIYPIIAEELGIAASGGVLVAFALIVVCGVFIAWNSRDPFGLFLATGLTFLIGLQSFINIGVVTGALPNKGLALPFISRGGTSIIFMLACVGMLLSVARRAGERPSREVGAADFAESLPAPQTG